MGEVPDNPEPDAKRHARRLFDDVIEARALGDCARLKLAFGAMRGAPGPVRAAAERLLLAHGRARGLLELRGAAGVQKTPGGEAASLGAWLGTYEPGRNGPAAGRARGAEIEAEAGPKTEPGIGLGPASPLAPREDTSQDRPAGGDATSASRPQAGSG